MRFQYCSLINIHLYRHVVS